MCEVNVHCILILKVKSWKAKRWTRFFLILVLELIDPQHCSIVTLISSSSALDIILRIRKECCECKNCEVLLSYGDSDGILPVTNDAVGWQTLKRRGSSHGFSSAKCGWHGKFVKNEESPVQFAIFWIRGLGSKFRSLDQFCGSFPVEILSPALLYSPEATSGFCFCEIDHQTACEGKVGRELHNVYMGNMHKESTVLMKLPSVVQFSQECILSPKKNVLQVPEGHILILLIG